MVELIAFDPQHTNIPLASIDFNAFDPIPLPLIALAGTSVRVSSFVSLFYLTCLF